MRFFSFFLAFLVTVFFPLNASSPSANSAQQPVVIKIIKAREGKFADGSSLTRKKLEELLATHREWSETFDVKKLDKEIAKARVKGEDQEVWIRNLLASDWEADQGRLVLKEADLTGVNLQGAYLWRANLRGAWLVGANLQGALYEPKPGALPDIVQLRSVSYLETLRFIRSPHGLEELKQAFKKAGMRQQEQEITHAIKRSEQENAWKKGDFLESLFNLVFFDLPVGYGLYPGRALKILASLIPLFAVFYGWVICRPSRNHGIYRLWPKERIEVTEDEPGMANDVKIERLNPKDWRIVTHALYFSLLSTFNIGWRELNVGNWISRLQLHPYTLQATGWVRATSGIQSLISVYLLAIWALTYFGRPFE
jgi:hypothetical protein